MGLQIGGSFRKFFGCGDDGQDLIYVVHLVHRGPAPRLGKSGLSGGELLFGEGLILILELKFEIPVAVAHQQIKTVFELMHVQHRGAYGSNPAHYLRLIAINPGGYSESFGHHQSGSCSLVAGAAGATGFNDPRRKSLLSAGSVTVRSLPNSSRTSRLRSGSFTV